MTPEVYVVGSIILAVNVIEILYNCDPNDETLKRLLDLCPRCGVKMQNIGSGVGGYGGGPYWGVPVVSRIRVLTCPQCGYSERSLT
jgi:ribosomal protein S27AE